MNDEAGSSIPAVEEVFLTPVLAGHQHVSKIKVLTTAFHVFEYHWVML